jgi:hypothetical protein
MWSVLAALYPVQRDGERVWKCKGHDSDLNFKDISIPVKMDDIPKFEKQNDMSINIFGYEKNEIFPVRIAIIDVGDGMFSPYQKYAKLRS